MGVVARDRQVGCWGQTYVVGGPMGDGGADLHGISIHK